MPITGQAIPLTAGQTAQVPQPAGGPAPCKVRLQNISPLALQVTASAFQDWIGPYGSLVVPWPGRGGVSVLPTALGTTPPAGAPASVLPTYFLPGEAPEAPSSVGTSIVAGTVDASVTGPVTVETGASSLDISGAVDVTAGQLTVVAGQSGVDVSTDTPPVLLGTIDMPPLTSQVSQQFTLPNNATGIVVLLFAGGSQPGTTPSVQIKGGVTGSVYAFVEFLEFGPPEAQSDGGPVVAAIPGAAENPVSVTVNWSNVSPKQSMPCAKVLALIGTGVQQVSANPNDPLPVARLDMASLQAAEFQQISATTQISPYQVGPVAPLLVGYDITLHPGSAAMPAIGVVEIVGSSSGTSLAKFLLDIQTLAGDVGSVHSAVLPVPLAGLSVGEGLSIRITTLSGSVEATGVVWFTVG